MPRSVGACTECPFRLGHSPGWWRGVWIAIILIGWVLCGCTRSTEIKIEDEQGRPLEKVTVRLEQLRDLSSGWEPVAEKQTGANGTVGFTTSGAPIISCAKKGAKGPASYQVVTLLDGYDFGSAQPIDPREEKITIQGIRANRIVIHVEDNAGLPVEDARVLLLTHYPSADFPQWTVQDSARTDAGGDAYFASIEDNEGYGVQVRKPGYDAPEPEPLGGARTSSVTLFRLQEPAPPQVASADLPVQSESPALPREPRPTRSIDEEIPQRQPATPPHTTPETPREDTPRENQRPAGESHPATPPVDRPRPEPTPTTPPSTRPSRPPPTPAPSTPAHPVGQAPLTTLEAIRQASQKGEDSTVLDADLSRLEGRDRATALFYQGMALKNLKRTDEAIRRFQEVVGMQLASVGQAHMNIGLLRMQQANWPEAIRSFQEAEQYSLSRAEKGYLKVNQGRSYWQMAKAVRSTNRSRYSDLRTRALNTCRDGVDILLREEARGAWLEQGNSLLEEIKANP